MGCVTDRMGDGSYLTGKAELVEEFPTWAKNLHTLVCRIDVQGQINVQVEKFLKNIKRAGQNRRTGGKFSGKSINMQGKMSGKSIIVQGGFFCL